MSSKDKKFRPQQGRVTKYRPQQGRVTEYRPRWDRETEDRPTTCPKFQSKIVGYFSVDADRNYLSDSSRLKYYKHPIAEKVSFDLNEGLESAVDKKSDTNGRMSHLLEWIKLNHECIQSPYSNSWIAPKFVCSSRVLTSVMCFPYGQGSGWIICAAKWKGSIYMCRFPTEAEKRYSATEPRKFSFWGHKFEQYNVSDAPDEKPDTSKPVVEMEEFRCIIRHRLGRHTILLSAEVDSIDSQTVLNDPLPLNDLQLVELKTCKLIVNKKGKVNFHKYKFLKWWAQSLVGRMKAILCGFRDENGVVRELKSYSPYDMVKASRRYWNPDKCVLECNKFLDEVFNTVVDDCDKTIYKFERKPFEKMNIVEKLSPESEYNFIPQSYLTATGQFPNAFVAPSANS